MKRKSRKTIEIPTDLLLPPSAVVGVSVSTAATMIIHMAIPRPPTINKKRRPKRSTVQVALSVKMIPKVALRALMRAICEADLKIFL